MPLIVLEGIDGSGTTSTSKLLVERIKKLSPQREVLWTCQPTQGVIGKFVRDIFEKRTEYTKLPPWRVMLHLFQSDKEEHFEQLRKWLDAGTWVVCDRYWYSGLAYQAASAEEGPDREAAHKLIRYLNDSWAPIPDLLVHLDVSAEVGAERSRKNGEDLYTNVQYLKLVRKRYLAMHFDAAKTLRINTGTASQVKVLDEIWAEVQRIEN